MPNIDNLIDTIQQNLNTNASRETKYFSTLDLKHACSQINLDPERARHCILNLINGEGSGTNRFITRFYGLTDIPPKFQKLETKAAAILNLTAPKKLKQLRSSLRSVYYLGILIPKLSQLCHPL